MKELNKCNLHPKYKAIYKPRNTDKHPKGCLICWEIFNNKNIIRKVIKGNNKNLVIKQLYCIPIDAIAYVKSDNKKIYDFHDFFDLTMNTPIMFLGKIKESFYKDPPGTENRGTKEKTMLMFLNNEKIILLNEQMDLFCNLIS